MSPTLALVLPNWAIGLSIAVFVLVSLLLIAVILLQRPQGGGLTAAFGGSAGAGQTAFGTKTGDALTIFTCLVFAGYVLVAIFLNHGLKPISATAAPAVTGTSTTNTAGNSATTEKSGATDATDKAATPPSNTPALPGPTNPTTTPPATNPTATPPTNPPASPEPKAPETAPKTEPKAPETAPKADPSAPKPADPNVPK